MTPPSRPQSGKRPERELRNAILALLRVNGIAAWPTGVGAFPAEYAGKRRFVRMGVKGMSDVIGCLPWCMAKMTPALPGHERHWTGTCQVGRLLAIEVKSPKGSVRAEQTAFLQTVVRAGGIGFVARSCEDVIDKLGLGR